MNSFVSGLLVSLLMVSTVKAEENVPPPPQSDVLVFEGGTIHTVSGESIADGRMVVAGGKIRTIGPAAGAASRDGLEDFDPDQWRTIALEGQHLYPGFISANTVLGLVEIQAVRATLDVQEPGPINPNARAEIALNPESDLLPVARANGVLAALTAPLTDGRLIAGRSAVIRLDGWTSEDMLVRAPVGMHIAIPGLRVPDGLEGPERREFVEQRNERLELLRTSLQEARAYAQARAAGRIEEGDRRWEAMIPVFARELPVFAHVDELAEIRYALQLAEAFDFRTVIVGGADAWRIADELADRNVPVILAGVHRPPLRRWEGYSTPSESPARLHAAGVKVAIANAGGTFVAALERNRPYEAGEAVAWGLDADEALRMITLYPAEILGVDDRLGSLDAGKDATFIVTDGDPLDIRTRVLRAFVLGREIDLSTRQTDLNDKYGERLRQLGAVD